MEINTGGWIGLVTGHCFAVLMDIMEIWIDLNASYLRNNETFAESLFLYYVKMFSMLIDLVRMM
jgi:hypothetical protein